MLATLIQETLEREFTQFVGVERFVRSPERRDVRNGHRRRRFTTRVGTIELRVPRDRAGRFQPSLFARYRACYQRSEQSLVLALTEMYFHGGSTRNVTTIVETLCGASVSASEVSVLTKRLDGELEAWRTRPLTAKAYPYLVVDAPVERVRREGQVRSTAALWVIGVGADGYREHLGVWLNARESGLAWRRVVEQLSSSCSSAGSPACSTSSPTSTRACSTRYAASSPTRYINAARCIISAMRLIGWRARACSSR